MVTAGQFYLNWFKGFFSYDTLKRLGTILNILGEYKTLKAEMKYVLCGEENEKEVLRYTRYANNK